MDTTKEIKTPVNRLWAVLCSIRTRYTLVMAFFLLLALGLFYIGGRIVLIHFIDDTELQVRDVGKSISQLAYRQGDDVRTKARRVLAQPGTERASARDLLAAGGEELSLVAVYSGQGRLTECVQRDAAGAPVPFHDHKLVPYEKVVANWIAAMKATPSNALDRTSTGIIRLDEKLHYVVLLPRAQEYVMFGSPFSVGVFLDRGKGNFGGMEIRVHSGAGAEKVRARGKAAGTASPHSSFGIAPMFSEAMDFYSGGFWKLREDPLEAIFAVRDIAGNAVTSISVSLPKAFAGATRVAVWRLSFFVAIGGIFFVLPLFWAQNRMLLNPLSDMTREILAMRLDGLDCPRLDWKGRDEFAQLAASVNRMVEMIAAKTVSLANSDASHQALIDGVPDGLVVFDLQGRVVSITKQPEGVAPLPGFFRGERIASGVFGEEAVTKFAQQLEETAQTGKVGYIRLKVQRPRGVPRSTPTRHYEARLTRLGQQFILVIMRDVTAEVAEHKLRLAAEQHAIDASKRQSLTGLAAGIAHDMNNVLSVVLNAAESEGADPSGDSTGTLSTIRDAVHRGASMMRELMTYAGENRIRLQRMSPRVVLNDVRPLTEKLLADNIDLVIGGSEGAPDVDIDSTQFWKVLFNIVKNAGEAIGTQPGRIELSARPFRMTPVEAENFVSEHPLAEGDGVLFRVEDDGPGIRPEIRHRIFDPYVSSKSIGRGLGLATVQTIVEAHGGGIRVESGAEGGTVFSIFLPASTLPPTAPVVPVDEPKPELSGEILVVDDDEGILKTSARLMKALKMTAHLARDRRESLAIIRRHAENLRAILLDANIGGIDTVRLLGAFRIGAPGVKIIVSSGSSEKEIEEMFKAHPYDDFLSKPYTIAELIKKI